MSGFRVLSHRPASRRQFLAGAASIAAGSGGLFHLAARSTQAQSGDASISLHDLLAFVPAQLVANGPDSDLVWTYADYAQQLASVGIPQEFGEDGSLPEWYANAVFPLATGTTISSYAGIQNLIAAIGFNPLAVDRALQAGTPPGTLTLFQGGIDPAPLPAAWAASGYEQAEAADGTTIWTIGRDAETSFDNPVQLATLANLNNVAILDDVLVYGTHFSLVEEAIATYAAGAASAAQDQVFGPVAAALPANTVSTIALHPANVPANHLQEPDVLEEIGSMFAASDDEVGEMPALAGLVLGITAGLAVAPPDPAAATPVPPDVAAGEGLALARLAFESVGDAEQAALVFEHRWDTWNSPVMRVPYADLMELTDVSVEDTRMNVTLVQHGSPAAWRELVAGADLLPFLERF